MSAFSRKVRRVANRRQIPNQGSFDTRPTVDEESYKKQFDAVSRTRIRATQVLLVFVATPSRVYTHVYGKPSAVDPHQHRAR